MIRSCANVTNGRRPLDVIENNADQYYSREFSLFCYKIMHTVINYLLVYINKQFNGFFFIIFYYIIDVYYEMIL